MSKQPRILNSLLNCYKKTFTYSGRESRGPYSMLLLCQHVWFLLYLAVIASKMNEISIFALAAFLLPMLAANVRRLHDAGYSGGWCLTWFCFTPYVMLIFARSFPQRTSTTLTTIAQTWRKPPSTACFGEPCQAPRYSLFPLIRIYSTSHIKI